MYTVAALYKFSSVDDPNTLQNKIRKRFKQLKIYGTILVGKEGINGTISAEQKNLQKAVEYIRSIKGFKNIDIKFSHSKICLLYTSPSPRDRTRSRMPSSA